jgi:hypothetical protein
MSRENATLETLETLDRRMAELASFLSPSEIFRALLEGTAVGAPRAAIFLMRDGRWKGWSSIGYSNTAAQSQRQTTASSDSGWLAALAAEEDVRWRSLASGESVPDFGQPHPAEAVGLPLRVGGKAVAILVAERRASEQPWSPAALSILCQAARLRLELDLAWRRLKSQAGTAAVAAHPVPEGTATAAATRLPEPAPAVTPAASPTEIAPWSGMAAGTADADPRQDEARRYARLIATDIRLYNEEAVVVGRRERDLVRRLGEQLKRGRDAFAHRFPDLGPEGMKVLEDAYVQVLAGGDPTLI